MNLFASKGVVDVIKDPFAMSEKKVHRTRAAAEE